jgi:hypothetical protein
MAKDKSGKKSAISEAGTLSLDTAQHEQAVARKDWKGGGGVLLPVRSEPYRWVVESLERGVSAGEKTAGSPKYTLTGVCTSEGFEGARMKLFPIAHGSTAPKYYKLLEVAFGYDIAKMDPKAIPLPLQSECDEQIGVEYLATVDAHKPDYSNPEITRAEYSLVERLSGKSKGGKKAKVGAIAK